ncbi:MAG: hypothetical protein DRP09_20785 [Candidatus Thorarchaeota archaeon]|nr:MAG: hypothetical protein DRP09_20785 [Candidatus Thorarchaeota archaeon]
MSIFLIDHQTFLIIIAICVNIYGFGLFLWWWIKIGAATEVYIYVTLLFLASAFMGAIGLYANALYNSDIAAYYKLIESELWSWSFVPAVAIKFLIIIRMMVKVYRSRLYDINARPDRRDSKK